MQQTQAFSSTLCLLVLSAHYFCKQIGHRSGPTKYRAWSGSNMFDNQMVNLKEFLKKRWFWKNQQTTKKHEKFPRGQRIKGLPVNIVPSKGCKPASIVLPSISIQQHQPHNNFITGLRVKWFFIWYTAHKNGGNLVYFFDTVKLKVSEILNFRN